MLTIDAASETAMKKAMPFTHNGALRDASFSSYLDDKTSKFLISSSQFEQLHPVGIKKPDQDTEIDIFSADKYFNEGEDGDDGGSDLGNSLQQITSKSSSAKFNPKMAPPPLPPPKMDLPRHHSQSGTPSVISESSWNSQNVLLHRNHPERKGNKGSISRRSFLAALGCNCSCGDENSVDIDPPAGEKSPRRSFSIRAAPPKRPAPKPADLISQSDSQLNASWIRDEIRGGVKLDQVKIGLNKEENIFRFPVLDSSAKTTGEQFLEMQRKKEEDDPSRKSMEVFGSPIQRNKKNSLNMLTWDAIIAPKPASAVEISENTRGIYNDAASDASSDLFEIESFATNPSQYLTRQASDGGMSSAFTQTCYAPSEASIEWSVVTASAADFSAMSDIEEMRSNNLRGHNSNRGISQNDRRSFSDQGVPKRRSSGILSGCYSQKAVNVAGDVYRTSSEKTSPGRLHKPDFSVPMTRFHTENEPTRFKKRNVQHFAYDSRLLFKH